MFSAHPLVAIIEKARIKAAGASGIVGEELIPSYLWSAFHNTFD
jgi:hypothetical protein